MITPFSSGTSLDDLPVELQSKIYSYVFEGATAQLQQSENGSRLPEYRGLLCLQLVCKGFHRSLCVLSEFLKNVTINVTSEQDLIAIRDKLKPCHLRLVRRVRVRAYLWPVPHRLGNRKASVEADDKKWIPLNVSLLLECFPNLKTLSLKQSGAHINTFRQYTEHGLDKLRRAAEYKTCSYPLNALDLPISVREIRNDALIRRKSTNPFQLTQKSLPWPWRDLRTPISGQRPGCDDSVLHEQVLTEFSQLLYICLKETAPRYGRLWYYNLLNDAVTTGIEMQFELQLLCPNVSAMSGDAAFSVDDWVLVEDATVSTKDWILRFQDKNHQYEILQVSSAKNWRTWLGGKLHT